MHAIIQSLLFRNSPHDLKLIMVDPKKVEFSFYNNIPHLYTPVITTAKKTIQTLNWAVQEMERRYDLLEKFHEQDIKAYHQKIYIPGMEKVAKGKTPENEAPSRMPYIVIVIDELADIMMTYPKELEACIVRLAQKSRAVGIHLILSTQRPEVKVITGLIKANVPSRIALKVASQIDSRTILDGAGAEKLLGGGDLLFASAESAKTERVQSAFISTDEIKRVVTYLKQAHREMIPDEIIISDGAPISVGGSSSSELNGSDNGDADDDLYEQARDIVVSSQKASTSYLQRRLKIGYSRAARLIDILEERGVVGPQDGAKPRTVLDRSGAAGGFGATDNDADGDGE
jgi:DNA segregation ATPase FtsK/SpoIIIE, S-DNA-T family